MIKTAASLALAAASSCVLCGHPRRRRADGTKPGSDVRLLRPSDLSRLLRSAKLSGERGPRDFIPKLAVFGISNGSRRRADQPRL